MLSSSEPADSEFFGVSKSDRIGLSATPQEILLASSFMVQIIHADKGVRHYGPFGDEDAAQMWMVNHGPANTLFTVLPIFDRIW